LVKTEFGAVKKQGQVWACFVFMVLSWEMQEENMGGVIQNVETTHEHIKNSRS
jgi:hypothetical protein